MLGACDLHGRREREASQELTSEELSLLSQLLAQQEHVTEQEHVTAPGAERSQRVHTDKQGTGQRSEAYPAVSAAACVQAPLKSHSQPKEPMHASNQSSHQQEGHRPDLSHLAPVSIRDTELVQTWVTQYQVCAASQCCTSRRPLLACMHACMH